MFICIRRVEVVIVVVVFDFDFWWVFFVGVVNVGFEVIGEIGEGNVWDLIIFDGFKGDLLRKLRNMLLFLKEFIFFN